MTLEEVTKNINAQPVGRATLVVNDKCADPTNYLYKINSLAYHKPDVVKAIAISILNYENANTSDAIKRIVDKHYNDIK